MTSVKLQGAESRFKNWSTKSPDGVFKGPFHASDLAQYMHCPQVLKYKRVDGHTEGGQVSMAMLCGSIFHNMTELWHHADAGSTEFFGQNPWNMTLAECVDASNIVSAATCSTEIQAGREAPMPSHENLLAMADLFHKYIHHPLNDPTLRKERVIANEMSFTTTLSHNGESFVFEGTIDRVREGDGTCVLEDLKTNGLTGRRFSKPSPNFLSNNVQLGLYALAMESKTTKFFHGDMPIHSMKPRKITHLRYFMPAAFFMNKSGKNKGKPKGDPVQQVAFTGRRAMLESVCTVASLIAAGKYFRIGLSGAMGTNCAYCRFATQCLTDKTSQHITRPTYLKDNQ